MTERGFCPRPAGRMRDFVSKMMDCVLNMMTVSRNSQASDEEGVENPLRESAQFHSVGGAIFR